VAAHYEARLTIMRTLLPLLLICICSPLCFGQQADDFSVAVTLTRGERSRDSNSTTTTITLRGNALVYEQTYRGAGASRRKPVAKEFKLEAEDKKRLVRLITEKNLLVTDRVEHPATTSGPRRYFEVSVRLILSGKKGWITIKGPRDAVKLKDERLYKDTTALIEELYRIINLTDDEIVYEEMVQ
jgi:hypothetical protein